ncbi:hypothetical protein [Peribacillus sp. S4]|uniref:hypothetical protein n=1 Tax=Peribacillus sp. S4 TaxID=3384451 RepID=UPI00398A2522
MIAIAPTDLNWFTMLSSKNTPSMVNFLITRLNSFLFLIVLPRNELIGSVKTEEEIGC